MQKLYKNCGYIILIFSVLVFSGGFIGFITRGSIPSLTMGSIFGLGLLLSSVVMFTLRKWGFYLAFALVLLLDAFFAYRFAISMSLFPAGIMFALSSLVLICMILLLSRVPRRR